MALELRTEPAFWVRLRRDRPLQRQGMFVPAEVFAATQKRKKVVTRKAFLGFRPFIGTKAFLFLPKRRNTMKHILKRLIKANFGLERM